MSKDSHGSEYYTLWGERGEHSQAWWKFVDNFHLGRKGYFPVTDIPRRMLDMVAVDPEQDCLFVVHYYSQVSPEGIGYSWPAACIGYHSDNPHGRFPDRWEAESNEPGVGYDDVFFVTKHVLHCSKDHIPYAVAKPKDLYGWIRPFEADRGAIVDIGFAEIVGFKDVCKKTLKREAFWEQIAERNPDKATCPRCENNYLEKDMVLDRIIPGAKGGKYERGNTQALCYNCNLLKRDKTE